MNRFRSKHTLTIINYLYNNCKLTFYKKKLSLRCYQLGSVEFLRSHSIKIIQSINQHLTPQNLCRVVVCQNQLLPGNVLKLSLSIWSKIWSTWILALSPGAAPSQYSPDGSQLWQIHSNLFLFLLLHNHFHFLFLNSGTFIRFWRNFNFRLSVQSVDSDIGSETFQNELERIRIFARIEGRKIFDTFLFDKVYFVLGTRVELILKTGRQGTVKSCSWIFCCSRL